MTLAMFLNNQLHQSRGAGLGGEIEDRF